MRMRGLVFLALIFIFSAFRPVLAQSPTLAESESFIVRCVDDVVCPEDALPELMAQMDAMGQQVTAQAEKINAWFAGLGFPPLLLDRQGGKSIILVGGDMICGGGNTAACHIYLSTTYNLRTVFLPKKNFVEGRILPNVLAHELAHGLDRLPAETGAGNFWLGEAVAEAIGGAWGVKQGLGGPGGFAKSLDLPFNTGTDEGYEKADYLLGVGAALGSADMVAYLADFFPIRAAENDGMGHLYSRVGRQTFDIAYPRYVARFNSMDSTLAGASGDYYNSFTTREITIDSADEEFSKSFDLNVRAFAADPLFFKNVEVNTAPDDEAKDLLMVAEIEIADADRIGDLQLVFEHQVAQDRQTRYLFTGIEPFDGGFVRVTNAADTPDKTDPQAYRLEFRAVPLEFDLPGCMAVNATAEIPLLMGSLDGVDNWELRPSAGTIEGRMFTAPSSAGDVQIDLLITSPITRAASGIAPVVPEVEVVDLGTIPVRSERCNIRMKLKAEGEDVTVTYNSTEDFSEVLAPAGVKLYMGAGRVAVFEPSEGWIPIPRGAQAMFMGQMQGMVTLASPPPWADASDNAFHRAPLMFSRWYEWRAVTDLAFPGQRKSKLGIPVACPLGGVECVSISYAGIDLVYNKAREVVEVTQGGQTALFEYGTLAMGRPPGW